jgi:hypothetical protein
MKPINDVLHSLPLALPSQPYRSKYQANSKPT